MSVDKVRDIDILVTECESRNISCRVETLIGSWLNLVGQLGVGPQDVTGSAHLVENVMFQQLSWEYAVLETKTNKYEADSPEDKAAKRVRRKSKKTLRQFAELLDLGRERVEQAWCSCCLGKVLHIKLRTPTGALPAFHCSQCGSPTIPCAALRCSNMAVRIFKTIGAPAFCAEHMHEIPDFEGEKLRRAPDLESWRTIFDVEYKRANLPRVGKMAAAPAGIAILAAAGAVGAAPAIGGAIGSWIGGYTGIVATNFGLALLGGGSLAAGGLGMAGGIAVIAATTAGLAGTQGYRVARAYLASDKSFSIELVRPGTGTPIIFSSGFLTESSEVNTEWLPLIDQLYPDRPVFQLKWGSKALKDLGAFGLAGAAHPVFKKNLGNAAAKAMKLGPKKLNPLALVFAIPGVIGNPWHTARVKADQAAISLAVILSRLDTDGFVLMGHSLGGRVMVRTAEAMGRDKSKKIVDMHLFGTAIGAKHDWRYLSDGVTGAIGNFHSRRDSVLKYLYRYAEFNQSAAGWSGFVDPPAEVVNIDVTATVNSHSAYIKNVQLSSARDALPLD